MYVWSAAHNPSQNHQQIDPPADGCLPDVPGQKSCPLYSPMTQYPVAAGSPLCQKVCAAYRNDTRQDASGSPTDVQVGYSCDAALCTTLGNGQSSPAQIDPLAKADLLQNACSGLAGQSGLRASWRSNRSTIAAVAQAKSAVARMPEPILTRIRRQRSPG